MYFAFKQEDPTTVQTAHGRNLANLPTDKLLVAMKQNPTLEASSSQL